MVHFIWSHLKNRIRVLTYNTKQPSNNCKYMIGKFIVRSNNTQQYIVSVNEPITRAINSSLTSKHNSRITHFIIKKNTELLASMINSLLHKAIE
jgi:hypothetical protein